MASVSAKQMALAGQFLTAASPMKFRSGRP
jgi:hypothetical protein